MFASSFRVFAGMCVVFSCIMSSLLLLLLVMCGQAGPCKDVIGDLRWYGPCSSRGFDSMRSACVLMGRRDEVGLGGDGIYFQQPPPPPLCL